MKKEYSKPFSKVVIFTDEEFCESMQVGSPTEEAIQLHNMDAKERQTIDFSDEESIW